MNNHKKKTFKITKFASWNHYLKKQTNSKAVTLHWRHCLLTNVKNCRNTRTHKQSYTYLNLSDRLNYNFISRDKLAWSHPCFTLPLVKIQWLNWLSENGAGKLNPGPICISFAIVWLRVELNQYNFTIIKCNDNKHRVRFHRAPYLECGFDLEHGDCVELEVLVHERLWMFFSQHLK